VRFSITNMKIIEHRESDDGSIVRQFPFDDNASRRSISGMATKKRALHCREAGEVRREAGY
jgi:hypothetical protein